MRLFVILISLLFCSAVFAAGKKAPAFVATVADAMVARETAADKPETKPSRLAPGESKPAETKPADQKKGKNKTFSIKDSVLGIYLSPGYGSIEINIPMKELDMRFSYLQPFYSLNSYLNPYLRQQSRCVQVTLGATLCPIQGISDSSNYIFAPGYGNLFPRCLNGSYFDLFSSGFYCKSSNEDGYIGIIKNKTPARVTITVENSKGKINSAVSIKKWALLWDMVWDIEKNIKIYYFIAKAKATLRKGISVEVVIYYRRSALLDSYSYDQIRCYAGEKYKSCQIKWLELKDFSLKK
ncbi:MAG: hypothetical protein V1928_01200 [Parcubacteria group bacterium]